MCIMAEHITRDTVYRSSSELFQSKRASAAVRICIFIFIYPHKVDAFVKTLPGKGQTKPSTSHILQSTFPRSVVKRMVNGFEEDRPQRIVCPPPTRSLHRVCPNWFDAAIKLNCANMALAGLEGNLGAGRGMRRCTANTLIPSSEILRIVKRLQEM